MSGWNDGGRGERETGGRGTEQRTKDKVTMAASQEDTESQGSSQEDTESQGSSQEGAESQGSSEEGAESQTKSASHVCHHQTYPTIQANEEA